MGKFLIYNVFVIGLPVLLCGTACASFVTDTDLRAFALSYDFRLGDEGSTNRSGGTLEVRAVNGSVWRPICWKSYTNVVAAVACRKLGLNTTHAVASPGDHVGRRTTQSLQKSCVFGSCGYPTTICYGNLLHVECAPDQPDDFAVRLTGGSRSNRGVLGIKVGGEWGSVCDDNFDSKAAAVVCHQLGFGRRGWMDKHSLPSRSATILLDDVRCGGYEARLIDCQHAYIGVHDCQHSEDVQVECPLPGDYVPRLQGGFDIDAHNGRLEVNISGRWRVVYASITADQARLACAEMGYPSSHARAFPRGTFDSGFSAGVSFTADCGSFAQKFSDCQFKNTILSTFSFSGAAGLVCSDERDYDVRLTGGGAKEGKLEVKIGGVWGTVCDGGFDNNDARVACRQLGYWSGSGDPRLLINRQRFGRAPTNQIIWLNNLLCAGYESSLDDCRHSFTTRGECTHDEDVAISCDVQEEMEIRLVGGADDHSGRVEVRVEDEWGTVCDDSFDNDAPKVICRQLGLPYAGARKGSSSEYVSGSGQIWLDGVSCSGYESSFSQCSHDPFGSNDCSHSEDVYIHCLEEPTTSEYSVRLEGGPDASEGRLEVFVNGQWGSVCNDHFDDDAAEVVCRQLGYNHGGEDAQYGKYGSSEGEILLDDVICLGEESSLQFCSHNTPGTNDCSHAEDVGVKCNSSVSTIAVAGGVLGSLAVLLIIAMIVCYARKRTIPDSNRTVRRANPAISTTNTPFQYTVNLQYNNTTGTLQTGAVGPAGMILPPTSPGVYDGPPKYDALFPTGAPIPAATADPAAAPTTGPAGEGSPNAIS